MIINRITQTKRLARMIEVGDVFILYYYLKQDVHFDVVNLMVWLFYVAVYYNSLNLNN